MKIFVPESNLANEADHMASMIRKRTDVRTYWHKDDRPGVHKSHNVTDQYQFLFNSRLKLNMIHFDANFCTSSPGKSVKDILGQAREQLERYHIEFQDARDNYGHAKQVITGKMGSGMQDDLAIAILMGPYWGTVIQNNMNRLRS